MKTRAYSAHLLMWALFFLGVWGELCPSAEAQTSLQIQPEFALPQGPDSLQIITPQPRTRVLDSRRTRLRQSTQDGEEEGSEGAEGRGETYQAQATSTTSRGSRTSSGSSSSSGSRSSSSSTRSASESSSSNPSSGTLRRAPGQARDPDDPYEYGRLIIITEFDDMQISVEGEPYPFRSMQGVILIANEEYEVVMESAGSSGASSRTTRGASEDSRRVMTIRVEPNETRVLMANMGNSSAAPRSSRSAASSSRSSRSSTRSEEATEESGFLGVSSSPRGIVYVDGDNTGQMTPARRIELQPGRHEVRIFYEAEDRFSETKNVLIRAGVNTNVFFRDRDRDRSESSQEEEAESSDEEDSEEYDE